MIEKFAAPWKEWLCSHQVALPRKTAGLRSETSTESTQFRVWSGFRALFGGGGASVGLAAFGGLVLLLGLLLAFEFGTAAGL